MEQGGYERMERETDWMRSNGPGSEASGESAVLIGFPKARAWASSL